MIEKTYDFWDKVREASHSAHRVLIGDLPEEKPEPQCTPKPREDFTNERITKLEERVRGLEKKLSHKKIKYKPCPVPESTTGKLEQTPSKPFSFRNIFKYGK